MNKHPKSLSLTLQTCGWDILEQATALLFKQMRSKLQQGETTDFTLTSKNQILTLRFGDKDRSK